MTRAAVAVLRHLIFQQHMEGFEPSLLDKFFDGKPHMPMLMTLCQLLPGELKSTVARDIESLLNTCIVLKEEDLYGLSECKWSLFTYDLNDFSGLSLVSFYDRNYICQLLIKTIERHGSRLQHVNASLEINERATNALCFGINAVLLVGSARESVSFDATL